MRILVLGYGNWLNNAEFMEPYEKSCNFLVCQTKANSAAMGSWCNLHNIDFCSLSGFIYKDKSGNLQFEEWFKNSFGFDLSLVFYSKDNENTHKVISLLEKSLIKTEVIDKKRFKNKKIQTRYNVVSRTHCSKCGSNDFDIGKKITEAGQLAYAFFCSFCAEQNGNHIGHRKLTEKEKQEAPLLKHTVFKNESCGRCGKNHSLQRHHWAPYHLFDDADEWPVSYLCIDCHALWHRKVTPEMAKK